MIITEHQPNYPIEFDRLAKELSKTLREPDRIKKRLIILRATTMLTRFLSYHVLSVRSVVLICLVDLVVEFLFLT